MLTLLKKILTLLCALNFMALNSYSNEYFEINQRAQFRNLKLELETLEDQKFETALELSILEEYLEKSWKVKYLYPSETTAQNISSGSHLAIGAFLGFLLGRSINKKSVAPKGYTPNGDDFVMLVATTSFGTLMSAVVVSRGGLMNHFELSTKKGKLVEGYDKYNNLSDLEDIRTELVNELADLEEGTQTLTADIKNLKSRMK